MHISLGIKELISIAEEGRRGRYKAAKMLNFLEVDEISLNLEMFIELLRRLLVEEDESLEEIIKKQLLNISYRLNQEELIELVTEFLSATNSFLKEIAGFIVLRNADKIEIDLAKELATRFIIDDNEQLNNIGIAIIKELKNKLRKDDIIEILEGLLNTDINNKWEAFILVLGNVGEKLSAKEVSDYLMFLIEQLSLSNLVKLKDSLVILRQGIPKKILGKVKEEIDRRLQEG